MIRWERTLEAVLLAAALVWPLALFANGYEPSLVKSLIAQLGAAAAAACWAGRSVEAGRLELPAGRGPWAAAGLAWLAWQPSPAPLFFLAALLGPASGGFTRRLQGAAALTAAAAAAAPQLLPDAHARAALLAAALPLCLSWERRPGEPAAPQLLCRAAAVLALAGLARTPSPLGVLALAGAALLGRSLPLAAAVPAVLVLAPVSDAQWLMLDLAPRPQALVALAAAVVSRSAAAGAVAAAALVSPHDAGPLGWLILGAAAAAPSSGVVVRVAPMPFSPAARRCAYLPLALLLAWSAIRPVRLFVSDARYNEALALADSDPGRALDLLAGVRPESPLYARAALTEAGLHRRAGRLEAAIAAYRRADDPRAHRAVGVLEAELGRWDRALAALKKAPADDERAWRLRLEASERLKDRGEQLEAARALTRLAPRDPASWYALSEAYQENRLYAESRKARAVGARASQLARRSRKKFP